MSTKHHNYWNPGDTVVVRDITSDGEVHRALQFFVVRDTEESTVLFVPDGTEYVMLHGLSGSGPLELRPTEMRATRFRRDALRIMSASTGYGIYVQWDVEPRRFHQWYVNIERPYTRTPIGFDTMDLELDIRVQPDMSWTWKDEDHLEMIRDAGVISEDEFNSARAAGHEAVKLIEERRPPFDEGWESWTAPNDWGKPELPSNWDQVF